MQAFRLPCVSFTPFLQWISFSRLISLIFRHFLVFHIFFLCCHFSFPDARYFTPIQNNASFLFLSSSVYTPSFSFNMQLLRFSSSFIVLFCFFFFFLFFDEQYFLHSYFTQKRIIFLLSIFLPLAEESRKAFSRNVLSFIYVTTDRIVAALSFRNQESFYVFGKKITLFSACA